MPKALIFCLFVDKEEYSSVLKEAKEVVKREPLREDMLSRPGTGFGELCEEDYIPTVSAIPNNGDNFHSSVTKVTCCFVGSEEYIIIDLSNACHYASFETVCYIH